MKESDIQPGDLLIFNQHFSSMMIVYVLSIDKHGVLTGWCSDNGNVDRWNVQKLIDGFCFEHLKSFNNVKENEGIVRGDRRT